MLVTRGSSKNVFFGALFVMWWHTPGYRNPIFSCHLNYDKPHVVRSVPHVVAHAGLQKTHFSCYLTYHLYDASCAPPRGDA